MGEIYTQNNLSFSSDFGHIAYDLYEPTISSNTTPKIIQIAHGMLEHKGHYQWLAQEFAKRGYIVAVSDHRGHGDSLNPNNGIVLGSMGEDSFARASYDLYKLTCILKDHYKGARIILLGYSMGSLFARRYLSLYSEVLDGLILSGSPAFDKTISTNIRIAKFLQFFGAKTFGQKFFAKKIFRRLEKEFRARNGGIKGWLCSDKSVMDSYKTDEKCQAMFDIESFLHLFLGMQEVYGDYPTPKNPHIPILFVSGANDASGHFGTGVQKALTHLELQGFDDVGILLYKEARHKIFDEPIKEQVVADINLWLNSKGL